jgi:hypothetical protein
MQSIIGLQLPQAIQTSVLRAKAEQMLKVKSLYKKEIEKGHRSLCDKRSLCPNALVTLPVIRIVY